MKNKRDKQKLEIKPVIVRQYHVGHNILGHSIPVTEWKFIKENKATKGSL